MRKMHRYTEEQITYIASICEGLHVEEIQNKFNERYKLNVTFKSIKGIMYRHNLKNNMQGHATRFSKGQTPWNKGKKGLNLGGEAGWFKKGDLPHTTLEVGTERVNNDDFVIVKVEQPNVWRLKHHVLYEKYKGEIPEGYKVIFADGDKRNFDIVNLLLISRSLHTAAVKRDLLFDSTEATKSGLLLAEYLMTVNKKAKESKTN